MSFFIIQKQLMIQHPQLREKHLIIQYYVSLDYPQKQKRLINWWTMMIQTAVRLSNEVYVSPADLENIFSLHGLKPVPLEAVLNILQYDEKIEWRNRDKIIDRDPGENISFLRRMVNILLPKKSNKQRLSRYVSLQNESKSKVIQKNILTEKMEGLKQIISREMENQNHISYTYIISKINEQSKLSQKSLSFIMNELEVKSWIKIQEIGGQKVMLFSDSLQEYGNKNWVEAQKQKFYLKFQINELQKKVQSKEKQKAQKYQLAKRVIQRDQSKAKQYLIQIKNIDALKEQIIIRTRALQDMLHQLEMGEQNFKITQILAKSQQFLKQLAVDPEKIQTIREENIENNLKQRQINDRFKQLNEDNQDDDDLVENMMNSISAEILTEQRKEKKKSPNKFVPSNKQFSIIDL